MDDVLEIFIRNGGRLKNKSYEIWKRYLDIINDVW